MAVNFRNCPEAVNIRWGLRSRRCGVLRGSSTRDCSRSSATETGGEASKGLNIYLFKKNKYFTKCSFFYCDSVSKFIFKKSDFMNDFLVTYV